MKQRFEHHLDVPSCDFEKLEREGWEYAGSMPNGRVVFKRPYEGEELSEEEVSEVGRLIKELGSKG